MEDEGLISNLDEAWNINYEDLDFGKEIGKGGFGSVYQGEYFGTPVAIKKIVEEDPDGLLYLEREVNVLKGMRHPNIVQFIGIAVHRGALFIITEYVDNGNLRKFLKDSRIEMPWAMRVTLANDIACAMAYLHSRNVIHRDLKSKNLLVGDNWKLKICDFGFARVNAVNRPMTLCGTDDWMAPEMILGLQYDNKVDVFSYGIVMCELITRVKISEHLQRKPTEAFGLNIDQLRALIPPDCPEEFARVAIDCCGYEPSMRPSFKDVIRRLKPILKTLPPWNPSSTPISAPAQPPSASAAAAAAAAPDKRATAAPKFVPPAAAQTTPPPKASPAPAAAPANRNATIPPSKGSAKPAPAQSTPKPATAAAASTPKPATATASTPKPATATASTPKPSPTAASTPKPATATASTPKPDPAASTPKPAPAASTPKPAPAASTPKPAPAASTPKPAPAASTPKPAPATTSSSSGGQTDPKTSVRYAGVHLKKSSHGLW